MSPIAPAANIQTDGGVRFDRRRLPGICSRRIADLRRKQVLEYFQDRNGRFGGMVQKKGANVLRLFPGLIPVVAIVTIYLNTGDRGGNVPPLPLVGGIVVLFLLIFGMAEPMRRAGHGPEVVADPNRAP